MSSRLLRRFVVAIATTAALAAWAPRTYARQAPDSSDMAVIVHPDVPVTDLTRADLRRVLLGDREYWAPGLRIVLYIRAPIARERDVAIQGVCQMTEAQFRQYWIAKVFRAESATGPKIAYSSDMAGEQVTRTAGAIAIVPASQVPKGAKVVRIDGKLPGQAGYKLN